MCIRYRPTGNLHLGNYLGAIKNFVKLQNEKENECIFCVVDLHAITVKQDPKELKKNIRETAATFIASGIDPNKSIIFNQSMVPAHSEAAWILSCVSRIGWLNRMTQFKDKAGKNRENASVGLFAYPTLMAADILVYHATHVPVGEDQVPHIEFTREVARRFNHLYGKEKGFEERAEEAIKKLGTKKSQLYKELKDSYQEEGDDQALASAQSLIEEQQILSLGDKERLLGYLEGGGKIILIEPEYKLTPASKMVGLDGQKMSKSYNLSLIHI